jgi:hypothetical protein
MSEENKTYPVDYREILKISNRPVIVGGQAVNLWASMYVPVAGKARYGSFDLDLLSSPSLLEELKRLPGWSFKRTPLAAFQDIRHAVMDKKTEDGRLLHVEIIDRVNGLEKADLTAIMEITNEETTYNVLDPVVMLKSKASNIISFDQDARQDVSHLHLLAKIMPAFFRDMHASAAKGEFPALEVEKKLRSLFKVLQDRKLACVFNKEKIRPENLVPEEFSNSFSETIQRMMAYQMPLAKRMVETARFKPGPRYATSIRP